MKKSNYVWYAAYGSNLSNNRFKKYIEGGEIDTSCTKRIYDGCDLQDEPIKNKPLKIQHELYFAQQSSTWCGHGIAFIKSEQCKSEDRLTLGRIYLIKKEQFVDILHQENGKNRPYDVYSVDFDKVINDKIQVVGKKGWYTRVIYLGEEKNHPVFTFTGRWNDNEIGSNINLNLPSRRYKSYIIQGIKEAFPEMKLHTIYCYLYKMGGLNYYEKVVKTRKEWECFQCGRSISSGELATVHQFYAGRGKKFRNYYCNKCKSLGS